MKHTDCVNVNCFISEHTDSAYASHQLAFSMFIAVHHRINNSPPPVPFLSQLDPLYTPQDPF
jgi:hypothetical protein